MQYSRVCEILGFTTPKSFAANATLAKLALSHFVRTTPIRYYIACDVLINAAQEVNA